jgi:hypothetical protein
MAFDPGRSENSGQRGYVRMEVSALPTDLPARSPSDTLFQLETFPSLDDREAFQCVGDRLEAIPSSQMGLKVGEGEQFATDTKAHKNYNTTVGQNEGAKPYEKIENGK